eukprot:NODE_173_length_15916_cov_0.397673.p8 type:complete len:115 gc:universal NODE_173_length_15916_cov_0.397673:13656-13312(-)
MESIELGILNDLSSCSISFVREQGTLQEYFRVIESEFKGTTELLVKPSMYKTREFNFNKNDAASDLTRRESSSVKYTSIEYSVLGGGLPVISPLSTSTLNQLGSCSLFTNVLIP